VKSPEPTAARTAEWLGALDSLRTFVLEDAYAPTLIQKLKKLAS
jgi:hypothetical protein